MKKHLSLFLVTAALSLQCSQKPKVSSSGGDGSWPKDMQSLAETLKSLFPYLLSPRRFEDPANKEKIQAQLKKFSELSHSLSEKAPPPDSDPTLRIVADEFQDEVARAQDSFVQGQYDYSRKTMMTATMYCIQCHTRNTQGPRFALQDLWTQWPTEDTIEKIEFMIALRQFDPALKEISEFLKRDRSKLKNPFDWDKVAQYGLQVSIRAVGNVNQALGFVDSILKSKDTPGALKSNAQSWKTSLLGLRNMKPPAFKKPKDRLDYAKKMIALGKKKQEYPLDRNADVEFLVASRELHDLLAQNPDKALKAEALYNLGMCYDVLKESQLWSLNESFYESCIHLQPGTPIAKQCFARYEASQKMGYSGSGGLILPPEVKKKLAALKSLSEGVSAPAPSPTPSAN